MRKLLTFLVGCWVAVGCCIALMAAAIVGADLDDGDCTGDELDEWEAV